MLPILDRSKTACQKFHLFLVTSAVRFTFTSPSGMWVLWKDNTELTGRGRPFSASPGMLFMCLFVCSSEPSQEQFDGSRRAVNSCPSFDVWTQNKMRRGSLTLSPVVSSSNHLLWRGPPWPPALPYEHEPRWGEDWKLLKHCTPEHGC